MTLINNTKLSVDQPLQYGEISTTCPCCGNISDSTTDIVNFDYWKGVIFKGDKRIRLEPMEADLLKIFLDRWPKICSREKLLVGLYGGNYCERSYSDNVGVYISKLRYKIKIFDIEIENVKSRGWWLIKQSTEDRNSGFGIRPPLRPVD